MPACSITSQTFAHESARKRGGESGAENGFSDLRTAFRVMMAAAGVTEGAAVRARRMSFGERRAGDDGQARTGCDAAGSTHQGNCCVALGEEFGYDVLACSAAGAEEEEMHGSFC